MHDDKQSVGRPDAPLLVNVGCGARFHPSWINLDLNASSPEVIACDLVKGLPLGDSSSDAVYSAALLEHIRPSDVAPFLGECYRVLRSGGRLRIAVPDFERQALEYIDAIRRLDAGIECADADRDWMVTEIIDQFSRERSGGAMASFLASPKLTNQDFVIQRIGVEGRELIKSFQSARHKDHFTKSIPPAYVRGRWLGKQILKWLLGSKSIDNDLQALSIGRFRLSGELHQWAYDRHSLRKLLLEAGFSSPGVYDHGQSEIPSWRSYGLEMDTQGNVVKPDLLIVECKKP